MKKFILIFITTIAFAQNPKNEIANVLDNWHLAAANAKFDAYMSAMTDDAIYIVEDVTTEEANKKALSILGLKSDAQENILKEASTVLETFLAKDKVLDYLII